MLNGALQLLTIDLVDEVYQAKRLGSGLEGFLIANDVSVVRAGIGCVDIQVNYFDKCRSVLPLYYNYSQTICGTYSWSS